MKAGKKQPAVPAGRAMSQLKKTAGPRPAKRCAVATAEPAQLRQVDRMLDRIERKADALSASADRLLRRVS